MTRARRHTALAAVAAIVWGLASGSAHAAGDVRAGAYCPFPKEGEAPTCLAPARDEYEQFFSALDTGNPEDADLARVEADVSAGPESERAYLALSSLAYGYYRLSQRAAATPGGDPAVVARLERWNALLATAFDAADDDDRYRAAVHEAALDLRDRAPAVRIGCVDAAGGSVPCDSTEAVMRGIDAAAGEVGLRGGLERLLERIVGADDS